MKPINLFCLTGIAICFSACSFTKETYFGAKYPPTDTVQTFYSAKDIKQPYKVIGHMIAPLSEYESEQERMKVRLIERAKKAGANALIFSDISRETHDETTDELSVKAEAIVFTDK
jgi:uncharacterized protein YbjQ (UPF0145 family)